MKLPDKGAAHAARHENTSKRWGFSNLALALSTPSEENTTARRRIFLSETVHNSDGNARPRGGTGEKGGRPARELVGGRKDPSQGGRLDDLDLEKERLHS